MKKADLRTMVVLGFTGMVSGIVGCGSSSNPSVNPVTTSRRLSAAFVNRMQNPAGCLDVEKVYKEVSSSKESRRVVTDISIPSSAGAPVSEGFIRSVIHNSILNESPIQTMGSNARQSSCDSITFKSYGQPTQVKLLLATPTKIVSEVFEKGGDPLNPSGFEQFSMELVADNEILETDNIPYTTPHDCGTSKGSQEFHQAVLTGLMDWGDYLPVLPPVTINLIGLEERAKAYDDPAQSGRQSDLERAYCQSLKN